MYAALLPASPDLPLVPQETCLLLRRHRAAAACHVRTACLTVEAFQAQRLHCLDVASQTAPPGGHRIENSPGRVCSRAQVTFAIGTSSVQLYQEVTVDQPTAILTQHNHTLSTLSLQRSSTQNAAAGQVRARTWLVRGSFDTPRSLPYSDAALETQTTARVRGIRGMMTLQTVARACSACEFQRNTAGYSRAACES